MSWIVNEMSLLPEIMFDYLLLFLDDVRNGKKLWSAILGSILPSKILANIVSIMEYVSSLLSSVVGCAEWLRSSVNDACFGLEPWQVAAYTLFITGVIMWTHSFFFDSDIPLSLRMRKKLFRFVRRLPWVQNKIGTELAKHKKVIERSIHECDNTGQFYKFLPKEGLDMEEVLEEAEQYRTLGHFDVSNGKVSGTAYANQGPRLTEFNAKIYTMFMWSNPLHPDVFPGVRKMEAEIVRMVCTLFHGDSHSCGNVTSGGTESLLLACLAYRNRAYDIGINEPEILVPVTGHAAFDKAGELFRMRVRHIAVDDDGMVNLWALRRAITSSTCMIVGSAPNFPYGTIDPIDEICRLASSYGIPVHVDACLGGFLIPFMKKAGFDVKAFDFRLPGVMSISSDTHKYGFAPKGSSVLMYRNLELQHYQYFCQPDWPGGIYASPTLAGSRCGANIAVCWATLLYHGMDKYIESTRKIIETTRIIADELKLIEGLELMGEPEVSVVAFTSKVFNCYTLSDRMSLRGWNLNALQFPSSVHLAVTSNTTRAGVAQRFVTDMQEICMELIQTPSDMGEGGQAAMYGMAQSIPDRSLVAELAYIFLDSCLSTDHPVHQTGQRKPTMFKKQSVQYDNEPVM